MRLQPSKSTMPFSIQAQAARHQPKQPRNDPCLQQPRLDGAKSDQLFFYGGHSSFKSRATGHPSSGPHPSPWALKLMLPPGQECQIAHLSTLSNPVDPHATQSIPSSDPNEPKGSTMEPKVIAIQATRYPWIATWSSKHLIQVGGRGGSL